MSKRHIRGIEISYDEAGSGPAVVLLHGYPFNRSLWSEQVELLRQQFRVIALDLRAHGESSVPPGPATMEDMARDVAELIETLGISRAIICGLSMGGYVALAFYRLFPLLVRALVLVDTRAQADTDEARANRERQAQQALNEGLAGIADAMLPKLLAPETVAKRPEVVARVRKMITSTKPEGAAAAVRGLAQRADQTSLLNSIIVPTLIIVGSEDALTPVADSETMHREIGGSRLEIIAGAGHVSNLEKPDAFKQVLLNFLNDLGA